MILNRKFYKRNSLINKIWTAYQMTKLRSENLYKILHLHRTQWPDKLYYYSPRLKRKPRFTGNVELLSEWREAKQCEIICPTLAIKVTSSEIIIDEKGCIECGLCLEFAPPGILESSNEL